MNSGNSLDRLLLINVLYTFIASAMAVIIPLYLLEQKVDITLIGLILSLGPLSFMIIRIAFASMADEIGTRAISLIYSAANLASLALYALFVSPLGFAAATLAEGIRNSGFWAIVRTEIILASGKDPGRALARFSNLRWLADGAGRLSVGIILAYLAFQGAFFLFFIFSLALFAIVATSKGKGSAIHVGQDNFRRIFKKRPGTFWHAALLQVFVWLAYNMLSGFLLPLYLISSLGLAYDHAGLLMAVLSIAAALFAMLLLKLNVAKRTLLLMSLISVPAMLLFAFYPIDPIYPLILLALGSGCGSIVAEYILVDQVYRSKDVSTDIGVLYVPLKVSEFLFLSLGGVAISLFGFGPLFILLAISLVLFAIFGRAVISG